MLPELATSCLSWADSPFLLAGFARRTFGTCCAHASPANDKQRYEDSCDSGEGMCWNQDTSWAISCWRGETKALSSLELPENRKKYFNRHWVIYRISRDCVVLIEIWDKVHIISCFGYIQFREHFNFFFLLSSTVISTYWLSLLSFYFVFILFCCRCILSFAYLAVSPHIQITAFTPIFSSKHYRYLTVNQVPMYLTVCLAHVIQ